MGVDLVYPEDGTVFPLRFEGLEFQWVAQQTPVRLNLSTDNQTLHVLTSEQSFVAEGPNWTTLDSTARGNRPITVSLLTLNQDGTNCQTPPIQPSATPIYLALFIIGPRQTRGLCAYP